MENTTEQKHLNVKESAKEHAKKANRLMQEFKDFLKDYKILGIAAGLVIGSAVTSLTQSIVAGLITPLIQAMLPFDSWKDMVFVFNGVSFRVGLVVNSFVNFLVVALLFFLFVKLFMKKEKVTKDALN